MSVLTLAATFHDPPGRMAEQIEQLLPGLARRFAAMAVVASDVTDASCLERLRAGGVNVRTDPLRGLDTLGVPRRQALADALGLRSADVIFFSDFDRLLHWAMAWPDELDAVLAAASNYDVVIYGRTPRAFDTHPLHQRETEEPVNALFARVSGRRWDVLVAARGFSPEAATEIVNGCAEQSIGTDAAWPLHLLRAGYGGAYVATEGLEFETPDRHGPEIDTAGGLEAWVAQLDRDPVVWAERLRLAAHEAAAMAPYATG